LYLPRESLSLSGSIKSGGIVNTGNLVLEWSNKSSFQFKVTRKSTGEAIFDTYGKVIVFEHQFLEVVTAMVPDYNIYGPPAAIQFRLPNSYTHTFWNL